MVSVGKLNLANNPVKEKVQNNNLSTVQDPEYIFKSNHYKTVKYIQENDVVNRAILDMGSGFVPVFLVELIGRNWQTAIETAFGNILRLLTNYVAPLTLVPLWSKLAAKKHNIQNIEGLFKIQFTDISPETSMETFKNTLLDIGINESKNIINKMSNDELSSLKEKLIDAKLLIRKLDLTSIGLLTYISPWIRNWFTKNILKVAGYPGELNLLSESERETGNLLLRLSKFALGLIPLFGGIHLDTKYFKETISSAKEKTEGNKIVNWIKNNIKDFDYHNGNITNRGNILLQNILGGVSSRLLASRSINEAIERVITAIVSLTGNFWGDLVAHKTLARLHDKRFSTQIVSQEGNKKVKTLNELEQGLKKAIKAKDDNSTETHLKSIQGQIKTYYQSMSLSALVMAVVTVFRIWNTNRRIKKGA